MRNMSFALTTQAFRERRKTITRRLGWWFLKPGDEVMGVEKGMGLKKGEKVIRLGPIRILCVRREPLNRIDQEDVVKEGFPDLTPEQFISGFTRHNKCDTDTVVNRIEFEYL